MAGLYFEQFEVEQKFQHEIRRTVSEADNVWFCGATYNPAQIHIDAEYCANTEFGKPLINSIFTLGLVLGLDLVHPPTVLGGSLPAVALEFDDPRAGRDKLPRELVHHLASDHVRLLGDRPLVGGALAGLLARLLAL